MYLRDNVLARFDIMQFQPSLCPSTLRIISVKVGSTAYFTYVAILRRH